MLDYNMVLCFFVVEVKMKVLLIFILFSVATTGVLSDLRIDVENFVTHFLYLPYRNVPVKLSQIYHAKQIFVMALLYPGTVTLEMMKMLRFKVKKLRVVTWKEFRKNRLVHFPMYYVHSQLMSIFVSVIDYARYPKTKIPVTAHPDYSMVEVLPDALKRFYSKSPKINPPAILMYSYHSPCNDCTDELIKVKSEIPNKIPVFLFYTEEYKQPGQTPEDNIKKLVKNKFRVGLTSKDYDFNIEHI